MYMLCTCTNTHVSLHVSHLLLREIVLFIHFIKHSETHTKIKVIFP